jgi:ELWxxDGT repeat protein
VQRRLRVEQQLVRVAAVVLPQVAQAAGTDTLYAAAGYQDSDQEHQTLWAIDPTTLVASPLGTFRQVGGGFVEYPLGSALGNALFFRTVDEHQVERWQVTEGTPGSTHPVPGLSGHSRITEFFTVGSRRYFTSCEDEHGCELWSTDRLGEETRRLTDLWPGPKGSGPQILTVSGNTVWFAATEPSVGRELWRIEIQ